MAHYAFLDENNIVTQVINGRDEDEFVEDITDWEEHYGQVWGAVCKRTSYNSLGNWNPTGKPAFRYNFASIGYKFDPTIGPDGAFIPPKPYPSWTLNTETCLWEPPIPMPDTIPHQSFKWDEELENWVEEGA